MLETALSGISDASMTSFFSETGASGNFPNGSDFHCRSEPIVTGKICIVNTRAIFSPPSTTSVEAMAASSGGTPKFEQIISQLSIDVLFTVGFKGKCHDVLQQFRMPQCSKLPRVREESPTFLFRLRLFRTFVDKWRKERRGTTINRSNCEEFFGEWRKYQDEQERACPVEDMVLSSPAFVERFFKPGCRELGGIVVRKSAADRLCMIPIDSGGLPSDVNELIFRYDANAFSALGLALELGDRLRVFSTGHRDEHKFDFELVTR